MSKSALMILGTASQVGKSIITAGLGRIFADEGYHIAPFKAQNMSLNSAATPDGREIGRAQALQAEACRVPPSVEMNPVLLKPSSDASSQVVLLGKVWGQVSAADYHTHRVEELFPVVLQSYQKLASQYDIILLEGAGSPAEINLRDHDIVNLRMAHAANAACVLVGDIDRGGVFAALLGTMELLEPADRELFKGFVINRFRGDMTLLQPGVEMIERRLGLPCVGVVPYLHDLGLDEEDSVAMEDRRTVRRTWDSDDNSPHRRLRIGVIALPHMSNFTDFDVLAAEPSVALAFVERADDVALADVLILPGTKQTLDDLDWLAKNGFASRIREHYSKRAPIIGLCGGFQMLGLKLSDPSGVENTSGPVERDGLELLSIHTVFSTTKTTRPVSGELSDASFAAGLWRSREFHGYEIHMGETNRTGETRPFARISTVDGAQLLDGAISPSGLVFGTYVHGSSRGITVPATGDIFLEKRRMSTMNNLGLRGCFPLLKKNAAEHMKSVLMKGFKAYVVCVDSAVLDESFVGCLVDSEFLNRLPPGVDICGENGEYHTFVVDGPIFTEPVGCHRGSIVHRDGFYFCDRLLDN